HHRALHSFPTRRSSDLHGAGLPLRVDEINSVACGGAAGVSNTFASALWALDTMFALVRTGVDGVNVHTFQGATYRLFRMRFRQRSEEHTSELQSPCNLV